MKKGLNTTQTGPSSPQQHLTCILRLKCSLTSWGVFAPLAPDKSSVYPTLKWTSSLVPLFFAPLSLLVTAVALVPHPEPGTNKHSCMSVEWMEERGKPIPPLLFLNSICSSLEHFLLQNQRALWDKSVLLTVDISLLKLSYLFSVLRCTWLSTKAWKSSVWILILVPSLSWASRIQISFPSFWLPRCTFWFCHFLPERPQVL